MPRSPALPPDSVDVCTSLFVLSASESSGMRSRMRCSRSVILPLLLILLVGGLELRGEEGIFSFSLERRRKERGERRGQVEEEERSDHSQSFDLWGR